MSLADKFLNAILGVPSPNWSANPDPVATQFEDPIQVSAAWLARQDSDAKAKQKDPFETATEYRQRLAGLQTESRERPHSLNCSFLLTLDEPGTFDADSQLASLRTTPFEFNCPEQRYNRLLLAQEHTSTGSYTLSNYFGAKVAGHYESSTRYQFQISNFRALAALRRKRLREDQFYLESSHSGEQLEACFPINRESARAELPYLRLGARVRIDDVSNNKGYSYGGDSLDVPDTHHKAWMILCGAMLSLDIINISTQQHLGGWHIHSAP